MADIAPETPSYADRNNMHHLYLSCTRINGGHQRTTWGAKLSSAMGCTACITRFESEQSAGAQDAGSEYGTLHA